MSASDEDTKLLNEKFKEVSTYNQDIVNQYLETIAKRKIVIQKLIDKMSKYQALNNDDMTNLNEYVALGQKELTLSKILANGKGGF